MGRRLAGSIAGASLYKEGREFIFHIVIMALFMYNFTKEDIYVVVINHISHITNSYAWPDCNEVVGKTLFLHKYLLIMRLSSIGGCM